MKLQTHRVITGKIRCETGTRIGGTTEAIGIGETDNPILRHPISRLPYIAGSSLKGRLRSLLEQRHSGRTQQTGRPCDCGRCVECRLFGCGDAQKTVEPGRLIFRDAPLTEASTEELRKALPGLYAEVKSEIAMDRKRNVTQRGSLRQQERVPAGTEFEFEVVLRVFDGDNVKDYLDRLAEGIELLEKEYLGGSGTRGYGKVAFLSGDGKNPLADDLRKMNP